MTIDLSNYTFEEFIRFIFDHPVTEPAWYTKEEGRWTSDYSILEHLIRLFNNPQFLLDTYTPEQIEQGFWLIKGPYDGFLEGTLWNPNVPWELRKELILSMRNLFRKLFVVTTPEGACFMWWHTLACDRPPLDTSDALSRPGGHPNDSLVENTIFETLCDILNLDSRESQMSALHGLGHLRHLQTERIIQRFLDEHPDIDEKVKEYAISCMSGKVQ